MMRIYRLTEQLVASSWGYLVGRLMGHDREVSGVCVVFNYATGTYITINFMDIVHHPNFYLKMVFQRLDSVL
jgi:hypothetical protein